MSSNKESVVPAELVWTVYILCLFWRHLPDTHISFFTGFIRIVCTVPLHLLAKYNTEYFDLLSGIVMLQECANEQSMAIIRK